MQLFQKMKKNRKGFTLVEMIVVLVILAILAAFTIPAMLGFVNDARSKAAIAQAREVYVAAQSAATEVAAGGIDGKLTASVSSDSGKTDAGTISSKILKTVTSDITGIKIKVTIAATSQETKPTQPTDKPSAEVFIGTDAKVQGVAFTDGSGNGIWLKSGGETETY